MYSFLYLWCPSMFIFRAIIYVLLLSCHCHQRTINGKETRKIYLYFLWFTFYSSLPFFFFPVLITWNVYKIITGSLLFNYYSSTSSQKLDKYILDHNITVTSPVKNQSPMTNGCQMPITKFNISHIWDQDASELIIYCKYLYQMVINGASHSNCKWISNKVTERYQ